MSEDLNISMEYWGVYIQDKDRGFTSPEAAAKHAIIKWNDNCEAGSEVKNNWSPESKIYRFADQFIKRYDRIKSGILDAFIFQNYFDGD